MNAVRLYTPGPLTTSAAVKAVMQCDVGSRDGEFTARVRAVRAGLVALVAPQRASDYSAILLPGSGTYAIEATIGSVVPATGRLLVMANGAYGDRMAAIAARLGVPHDVVRVADDCTVEPAAVESALDARPEVTHVAVVHCETTTGILNPLAAIADVTRARGRALIVDGMSSVGALPIDMPALGIQYLIASSNKCLEGVPGLSFVVAERAALASAATVARSYSLDLEAQSRSLDADGQFRFTPPTHVVLAVAEALDELHDEGGVTARGARYARNQRCLVQAMRAVGFRPYLPVEVQGPIITTFHQPAAPFVFETFYQRLHDRGFVIYPGKLTAADTFRVGSIGQLFPRDMEALARAAQEVLDALGIRLRAA